MGRGWHKRDPDRIRCIVDLTGIINASVKYPPTSAATANITSLMTNSVLLIPPRLTICPGTLVISDRREKLEYCVINRPTDYTERLHRAGGHNSLSHAWTLTCN